MSELQSIDSEFNQRDSILIEFREFCSSRLSLIHLVTVSKKIATYPFSAINSLRVHVCFELAKLANVAIAEIPLSAHSTSRL